MLYAVLLVLAATKFAFHLHGGAFLLAVRFVRTTPLGTIKLEDRFETALEDN